MAHVRRRPFLRPARSHRKVTWNGGPRGRVANESAAAINVFPTALTANVDLTLIRVRGELVFGLEAATAVDDGFDEVAFGICNVSANAAGVGVTAIPDPLGDIAWDGWLYHYIGSCTALGSATLDNAGGSAIFRLSIDGKAMRKMNSTDVTVAVITTGALNGGVTFNAILNSRILDMIT